MRAARGNLYRPKHRTPYLAPKLLTHVKTASIGVQAENKYNLNAFPSLFAPPYHFPQGCIGVRQRCGRFLRGRGAIRIVPWNVVDGGLSSPTSSRPLGSSWGLRPCPCGTGPSVFLKMYMYGRHYTVLNSYFECVKRRELLLE